jgi:transposase
MSDYERERQVKSRGFRWMENVERMEEMRNHAEFLVENLKGRNHSEDHGVDGRMLKRI